MGETGGGIAAVWPFLIPVFIGVAGIVAWLIVAASRERENQTSAQPRPSQPAAQDDEHGDVIAVRRSGFGDWEIYMRGQRIRRMAALTDPEERKEFLSALRALVMLARGEEAPQGSEPQRVPSPGGGPASSAAPSAPSASGGSPAASRPPDPAQERRERYGRASAGAGGGAAVNLVDEINDILEEMIDVTPSLEGHSVSLIHAPTGGVSFVVDGKVYGDLSEVPEAEIRSLIRRATKEWERR